MKKRKSALTLLEVMIALSLTGMLLFILFGLFKNMFIQSKGIQTTKEGVLYRSFTQQRLSQALAKVKEDEAEKKPILYQEGYEGCPSALFIHYDNGVDSSHAFSHEVQEVFYLNNKGCFCSDLIGANQTSRKDVFLQNVQSITWQFFNYETLQWQESWPKELNALPTMIKLSILEKSETNPHEFAFFLFTTAPIVYSKGPKEVIPISP